MASDERSYPRLLYNAVGETRRVASYDDEVAAGQSWQCGPDGKRSSSALPEPIKDKPKGK